jgi:hypothetical protein
MILALGACQAPVVPASPGPEGWLPVLDKDPTLALSNDEVARERGFSSDNPKVFTVLPSGALRAASTEAGSMRRDIDTLLLTTPYLTWRWRLEPGPLVGVARLHLAVGFKTGSAENRLIIAWSDNPTNVGRLERKGNAAYFIAQGGTGDGNWREATLDIAELHRLAWPDINTLDTRVTYVALFMPETKGGPAVEIERLALIR